MPHRKFQFGFPIRPVMKLSLILEVLNYSGVIKPVPSKQTLINIIEEGKMAGFKDESGFWYVYEDSFRDWVKSFQPDAYKQVGEEQEQKGLRRVRA